MRRGARLYSWPRPLRSRRWARACGVPCGPGAVEPRCRRRGRRRRSEAMRSRQRRPRSRVAA